MKSAAEIADSYLAGHEGFFDAARQLVPHIDERSTLWKALNGANGPLPVIYQADEVADQLGFFVSKEVQWEPKAFQDRQAQLTGAEIRLAPAFRIACKAIVEYAKISN